ncbi:MAG: UDP-2,3-diacylglucosamine diphosphatase, partial [Bacteroidota bacterium]
RSRLATGSDDETFKGEDKEWLVVFCKEQLKKQHYDFFIFGHRHLPIDLQLPNESRYINLGEWLHHCMYARFDGTTLQLMRFED